MKVDDEVLANAEACGYEITLPRRSFLSTIGATALLPVLPISAFALAGGNTARPLLRSVNSVTLDGVYPGHVQGVCSNNHDLLYWSMTTSIVMTDATGKVLKKVHADSHQGDLCYLDGKLYVGVNKGVFNDSKKRAESWIYVFDANDLTLLAKQMIPEVIYGAGGMTYGDGKFLVVGGLPDGHQENYLYEYDRNLKFIRQIALKSGWTQLGIQTATYHADQWWFGCYGSPQVTLRVDKAFQDVERFILNTSYGIVPVDDDTFLIADSICSPVVGCEARMRAVKISERFAQGR